MKPNEKIDVLVKIAKVFNEKGFVWAIGGSLLLYLKGVIYEFNDIDIMINEQFVEEADLILQSMGKKIESQIKGNYTTEYFFEYIIDDVEIDLMANFALENNNIEYIFPLEKEDIHDHIKIHHQMIPLQSLETWYEYYKLMNRTDKIIILESYLGIHK